MRPLRVLSRLVLALATLLALCACGPGGELVFFRRAGAELPIWIRGNTESGVYLLWVHGGPGNAALNQVDHPFFQALEERYAVVYWDQRASGSAQGDVDPSKVTLEDYVLDTDGVIDLLRARPSLEKLFVLGHSWGGTISPAYLVDEERQAKVDGYVHIDGSHNVVLGLKLAREWVLARIDEEVADDETWTGARAFYEAHPVIGTDELDRHIGYVQKAGGYVHGAPGSVSIPDVLYTPVDLPSQWSRQAAVLARAVDLANVDLSDEMAAITLPTLVLWGEHDGTLPVGLAQDAFDSIGTPAEDKRLVVLGGSAHYPHTEEAERALDVITSFIEAYR